MANKENGELKVAKCIIVRLRMSSMTLTWVYRPFYRGQMYSLRQIIQCMWYIPTSQQSLYVNSNKNRKNFYLLFNIRHYTLLTICVIMLDLDSWVYEGQSNPYLWLNVRNYIFIIMKLKLKGSWNTFINFVSKIWQWSIYYIVNGSIKWKYKISGKFLIHSFQDKLWNSHPWTFSQIMSLYIFIMTKATTNIRRQFHSQQLKLRLVSIRKLLEYHTLIMIYIYIYTFNRISTWNETQCALILTGLVLMCVNWVLKPVTDYVTMDFYWWNPSEKKYFFPNENLQQAFNNVV